VIVQQGHDKALARYIQSDKLLRPLTREQLGEYPVICHGSYQDKREAILASGLDRMDRMHIHMVASDKPGDNGVMSGMPSSHSAKGECDMLVYVDAQSAMDDGIRFYISENGVILSEGDSHGRIVPRYIKKIAAIENGLAGRILWPSPMDTRMPDTWANAQNSRDLWANWVGVTPADQTHDSALSATVDGENASARWRTCGRNSLPCARPKQRRPSR